MNVNDFPYSIADRGKLLRSLIEQPPPGRTGLHVFLEHFWPYFESAKFVDGRPLHWMCEFYEAWLKGDIRNAVLSAPPAMGKTIITNIAGPCYDWTARGNPEEKWLFGAHDDKRLVREARRKIGLLASPLMQAAYPEFNLGKGRGGVEAFTNGHEGGMLSVTTGTMVTGWHCNKHVYDDLLNPFRVNSEIGADHQNALLGAAEWVFGVVETRMGDMKRAQRLMVMQRIHDEDPAGMARRKGWEDLSIDIYYEPPSDEGKPYHFGPWTVALDTRTEPNENAWPERYPEEELAQKKENLGPAKFNAQFRQRPTTAEGGLLKRAWLHCYETRPNLKYARICQSWDAARKGTKESHSRVASASLALFKDVVYILEETTPQHLDYVATKQEMTAAQLKETYALAGTILIEDQANGTALLSDLRTVQPGYVPPTWTAKLLAFEPGSTDFIERMNPFLDRFRNRSVLIPKDGFEEWIDEMVKVPSGTYNDRWDVISQGLAFLVSGGIANYSAALKTVEKWR